MGEIDNYLNQYKIPIVLSLVGLVLIIGGLFSSGLLNNFKSPLTSEKKLPAQSLISKVPVPEIKVDISGAIKNPGVYTLVQDSRLEDLIKVAGGFSTSASAEYISKDVNLSQKLSDAQKIYIPFEGEQIAGVILGASRKLGRININTASASELDSLPGVGAVTVQKIIDNRPYSSSEDLLNQKAVSKSTFEKIKDLIEY